MERDEAVPCEQAGVHLTPSCRVRDVADMAPVTKMSRWLQGLSIDLIQTPLLGDDAFVSVCLTYWW